MKHIILIGFWSICSSLTLSGQNNIDLSSLASSLEDAIDTTSFEKHLYQLAKQPHRSGTKANQEVANYLDQVMSEAGFKVKKYPYDIYMPTGPGKALATIITPHRQILNNQEDILPADPYSDHEDLDIGWNAYSGSGKVSGEVVYANYGKKEDFDQLKELGISVKGKIVVARYGGNYRGFKAKFAEEAGAIGLIMYTDPKDAGYVRGLSYPEGPFYNASTIQRGSVLTLPYSGDPLTPFLPALPLEDKSSPNRLDPSTVEFHTIPVLPLSYGSAKEILKQMQGKPVPTSWQGGLPFTYRLTGGSELTVGIEVEQEKDYVRIENVIGTLRGTEYPDEWIILGCHYDAWGYGTTDPNSGTAMLLSLAETLGRLQEKGQGPKRSILIGHWDAEEYGILGSTEWVEQMNSELNGKAIAYINADAASSGIRFSAAASPSLKPLIHKAAKHTSYMNSSKTIWQHWLENQKKSDEESPSIGNLGGGSDHLGFYSHLAIPAMAASMSGSTLYHSNYDDLHWFHSFGDSTYQNGITLAKLVGLVTLQLSEKPLIPLSLTTYGSDLQIHLQSLVELSGGDATDEWSHLIETANQIEKLGIVLDEKIETYSGKNMQKINKKLIGVERNLLLEGGMPFGAWYQSIYACSDPFSGYAAWMLPGLRYYIEIEDRDQLSIEIKKHENILDGLYNSFKDLDKLLVH